MTKKVNKKNAIVLILVLLVVGLIYWLMLVDQKLKKHKIHRQIKLWYITIIL